MILPRITDMPVAGKRLLVRADLNVPMKDGRVTDTTRITRFAEGMKPLIAAGARLVIITHFGRPDPNEMNAAFSVDKLRPALAKALGVRVRFSDTCATKAARLLSQQLKDGEVLLCENLRLNQGETLNDPTFAAELAMLGDIYVNDAFSCAHRAHASTDAITSFLPATAGPLLTREVEGLEAALNNQHGPTVALIGGAKLSDKVAILEHLVTRVESIILGGALANTFLFADGIPMGRSLYEPDQIPTVKAIRKAAAQSGCKLLLPRDIVYAREQTANARNCVAPIDKCPDDAMILDAGPDSLRAFELELTNASTLLWNGSLGAFETEPFGRSTLRLAQIAADLIAEDSLHCIAGGGGTVDALRRAGVFDDFCLVSTAESAFRAWLEGQMLPGIAALMPKDRAA